MPPNYFCVFEMQSDNMFADKLSDFTINSGRTKYEAKGIELEKTFAIFDNDCAGKNDYCPEYGYMSDSDFVNKDEVKI